MFVVQAEDGIRDVVRSRGLGDVYKRQAWGFGLDAGIQIFQNKWKFGIAARDITSTFNAWSFTCLLYTSDAADERSSVDLGGRRIIKKKKTHEYGDQGRVNTQQHIN